ncbi:uncharacterized protein LOC108208202 [Daucus carota subsp. sativus]|uniref:uncharacterized protein LOC108208202 n=1 Tax=Daucus carota subsp. sativus TaxID=79200 RepID=UPI0007EF32B6|nr:PREDICTED: uncharacterized protein LOC108208202 [Daucus carota subsp. sativus]
MSKSDESIKVKLDDIFAEWDLWASLLLSLFLQIILSFGGTFRRLVSHKWIVIILWLAYLLAEVIALFGLGLIASRQSFIFLSSNYTWRSLNFKVSFSGSKDRFYFFWAPFLLVHLGGPDTITAFAPEDNELWPRHLFILATECIAVAYAFYQSEHLKRHLLMIPMLLMCLCGIIKCFERTAALYYGSANSFRNSMLSKSLDAKLKKESKLPTIKIGDELSHLQVLQYAFVYFTAFKGLVVNLRLSIHERNQSREFFLATSCKDSFNLVEVELNYIYDVLFTKIPVLHQKLGYCCRVLSFSTVVASFTLFHLDHYAFNQGEDRPQDRVATLERPVHNDNCDVVITYILLIGAVVLEVIAFYMLLFCDWTVIKLRPLSHANHNGKSWKDKFLSCILLVNKTRNALLHRLLHFVGDSDHHTKSDSKDSSFLNGVLYVKPQPLNDHMTGFIFDELKRKSKMASSLAVAKDICSSKGERILSEMEQDCSTFLDFVVNFNYDDILLLWHIATELCYNDSQDQIADNKLRDTAKKLSDYMLYLMVVKPDMMSGVSSIGEIKFQDTCTKVSKFLDSELPQLQKKRFCNFFRRKSKEEKETLQRKACETILSIDREVEPGSIQLDTDIFTNASVLAKQLQLLPSETKWLMISKLWVELLSYAATHIRSSAHAKQLSRGGELITVVWLLMAHFGLGDEYEINQGTQKSQLTVEKVRSLSINPGTQESQ